MASYAAQLRAQLGTQVNLRRRMFDDSQGKVKAWWFRTCIPTCVRDGLFQGTMGLYTDLLHVVHTVAAVLESHPHAYVLMVVNAPADVPVPTDWMPVVRDPATTVPFAQALVNHIVSIRKPWVSRAAFNALYVTATPAFSLPWAAVQDALRATGYRGLCRCRPCMSEARRRSPSLTCRCRACTVHLMEVPWAPQGGKEEEEEEEDDDDGVPQAGRPCGGGWRRTHRPADTQGYGGPRGPRGRKAHVRGP
jgi:hypothetical protein